MGTKYTAVGRKLQIGEETTYGELADMDLNMYYDSESLKLDVKKTEESNLLAATTTSDYTLSGYDVSGDISIKLKPENLPILKYAFNEGDDPATIATGVYKHTLTLMAPGVEQKSFSATVDRGPKVLAYTGLIAESVALEGTVREPITMKMTVKGQGKEVDGTIDDLLEMPSIDTFSAISGVVTVKGTTLTDVTKASLEISNGLDSGEPTYGSGMYNNKHIHGKKEAKPNIDAFYNEATSDIREADFKGNTYIAETIEWVSPKQIATGYPYKIRITMPKVSISNADSPNSGTDTKKITLQGNATSNGGAEAVTIEIWDATSTKY